MASGGGTRARPAGVLAAGPPLAQEHRSSGVNGVANATLQFLFGFDAGDRGRKNVQLRAHSVKINRLGLHSSGGDDTR